MLHGHRTLGCTHMQRNTHRYSMWCHRSQSFTGRVGPPPGMSLLGLVLHTVGSETVFASRGKARVVQLTSVALSGEIHRCCCQWSDSNKGYAPLGTVTRTPSSLCKRLHHTSTECGQLRAAHVPHWFPCYLFIKYLDSLLLPSLERTTAHTCKASKGVRSGAGTYSLITIQTFPRRPPYHVSASKSLSLQYCFLQEPCGRV